jgi:hypothetical protein
VEERDDDCLTIQIQKVVFDNSKRELDESLDDSISEEVKP